MEATYKDLATLLERAAELVRQRAAENDALRERDRQRESFRRKYGMLVDLPDVITAKEIAQFLRVNPNTVYDSAGYGLAQWTYWSRKQGLLELAKSKSVSIGNIDMQLEYLWSEMQSYHGMMVKLKNTTSVEDATSVFMLEFERPADQSGEAQQGRVNFSQSFYGRCAGKAVQYKEKEETEMRYNKISEMPEWAKPTIEKMIGLGIIGGGGVKDENGDPADLDLSHDMIRVFVSNDRAGLYS